MKNEITIYTVQYTRKSGFNYEIKGNVNGTHVKSYTNDSRAYGWLLGDSEPELHEQAVKYCETKLMEAYLDL